jgi:hypothetical protein
MLVSLMISVNLRGFICFGASLKFSSIFMSSNNLLNVCLTVKLWPCRSTGGEYEKLNMFFRSVGITHLVSFTHAHQQNGAAERKHRHIVEMKGLALLATASMPLKYWSQAFFTATYLISHTPSKLLDFHTSIHCFLGATPDYTSLQTFGCACWLNLRPYNSRTLSNFIVHDVCF